MKNHSNLNRKSRWKIKQATNLFRNEMHGVTTFHTWSITYVEQR